VSATYISVQDMAQDYRCNDCNLVLISIEPTRADHMSVYGYERNTTPNIDSLAQKSLVFERAFTQSPHTLPATISTFTSQYLSQHGVYSESNRSVQNQTTLVDVLNKEGYHTWAIAAEGNVGYNRGLGREEFDWYKKEQKLRQKADHFESRLNKVESGENFFLFYQQYAGHDPYLAPSRFSYIFNGTNREFWNESKLRWNKTVNSEEGLTDEAYREYRDYYFSKVRNNDSLRKHAISEYDGEIRHIDAGVGLVIEELKERDMMDNTVVVVMSEHGELLGEHDKWRHYTLWNEVIRVPLIIYTPDSDSKHVNKYVELIDLAPTIMDILGVKDEKYDKQSSGKSIIKQLREEVEKDFVLSEHVVEDQRAFIDPQTGLKYYRRGEESTVYNISRDFSEEAPINDTEVVQYMRKEFEKEYKEIRSNVSLDGGMWPYFSN